MGYMFGGFGSRTGLESVGAQGSMTRLSGITGKAAKIGEWHPCVIGLGESGELTRVRLSTPGCSLRGRVGACAFLPPPTKEPPRWGTECRDRAKRKPEKTGRKASGGRSGIRDAAPFLISWS
jgi:hypothetical protein